MNFPSYLILECFGEAGTSYRTYGVPPLVRVNTSQIGGKNLDIEGTGAINIMRAFTIETSQMDGVPSHAKSVRDCVGLKPFIQRSTIRIESIAPTTARLGYKGRR